VTPVHRPIAGLLALSLTAGCVAPEAARTDAGADAETGAVAAAAAPSQRPAFSPLAIVAIAVIAGVIVLSILVASDDAVEVAI
jgi:hypothetical protein